MKVNEKIKGFLMNFNYEIMHEQSKKNQDIEHFFVGIDKSDIKNSILKQYIEAHCQHTPLDDLSDVSMNWIKNNDSLYYVIIDSLDKSDSFYKQKFKFIQNNAANILSIKWTGQPVDISTHLMYNADKYMDEFKDVSVFIANLAKKKIVNKGKILIDENKELVKKILKK